MLTVNKHFRCKKEEWDLFMLLCKKKGSNASVEIRKFINSFNQKETEKIKKINELDELKKVIKQNLQKDN